MAYRALTAVLLGHHEPAQPGELLPDTYPDMDGHPVPIDFARLIELGAAEPVEASKRRTVKR